MAAPETTSSLAVASFDRRLFSGKERFTYIGTGSWGAKANGLKILSDTLDSKISPLFTPSFRTDVPPFTVIASDVFDLFLAGNGLSAEALSTLPDDQITSMFRQARLPGELVEDLGVLLRHVHVPIAVRSSSQLEDAMHEPLAGVYTTKMLPNNQPDVGQRLRALGDAIKYVYASTFLGKARSCLKAAGHVSHDEKMAVIIQEVAGVECNGRFYPHVSGVARSFNFYPTGLARPDEGAIELALGLGKTIMEDGVSWSFSPAHPHVNPPYNTPRDLVRQTQKGFWAIDMTPATESRHSDENEHLRKFTLLDAEKDGSLPFIASTYEVGNDRIVVGLSGQGPRVLDFAPILKADVVPLSRVINESLQCCAAVLGAAAEIEFAVVFPESGTVSTWVSFLQLRPLATSQSGIEVHPEELQRSEVLVASESTLGSGMNESIRDVVYVRPEAFAAARTRAIVQELESINQRLVAEGCPYLLIGFGRWGSSDLSVGIPVNFGQISGARVIVEATLPDMDVIPSQGSHFFHNIASARVLYLTVAHTGQFAVDWDWLGRQRAASETDSVRHLRLSAPLTVKVDGRSKRGVIFK